MSYIFRPSTTTTTTTRQIVPPNSLKNALCIGINDYPGTANDLGGCVNDALEWADILKTIYGFNVTVLLNKEATKQNFISKASALIAAAVAGSHVAITYSGHGTTEPDFNGDEPDGRDEAICLYGSNLIDDDIREVFSKINPEAKLTFVSDSCHSGTVTRAFLFAMSGNENPPVPRYLPPEDENEALKIKGIPPSSRIFYPEENMKEILISGCLPTEYSYDASFNGKAMGAMSYYATRIIRANPNLTYSEFYKKLREDMPSERYPQTPQLEGSEAHKNTVMFS